MKHKIVWLLVGAMGLAALGRLALPGRAITHHPLPKMLAIADTTAAPSVWVATGALGGEPDRFTNVTHVAKVEFTQAGANLFIEQGGQLVKADTLTDPVQRTRLLDQMQRPDGSWVRVRLSDQTVGTQPIYVNMPHVVSIQRVQPQSGATYSLLVGRLNLGYVLTGDPDGDVKLRRIVGGM